MARYSIFSASETGAVNRSAASTSSKARRSILASTRSSAAHRRIRFVARSCIRHRDRRSTSPACLPHHPARTQHRPVPAPCLGHLSLFFQARAFQRRQRVVNVNLLHEPQQRVEAVLARLMIKGVAPLASLPPDQEGPPILLVPVANFRPRLRPSQSFLIRIRGRLPDIVVGRVCQIDSCLSIGCIGIVLIRDHDWLPRPLEVERIAQIRQLARAAQRATQRCRRAWPARIRPPLWPRGTS